MAYINLVLALYKKRPLRLDNFWFTVIVILAIGVFWEWGSDYLRPDGTADPWDLLAYLLGGCTYYGVNKYLSKREYNKNE